MSWLLGEPHHQAIKDPLSQVRSPDSHDELTYISIQLSQIPQHECGRI